jgi:DNA-binding response OmpR family regulator
MLTRDVWKEPGGVLTNVIDVCVNSLRKKVELLGTKPLILTVRGVGYTVREL